MPTKEQVKDQFRESFDRADTDGTGKLTKDQVDNNTVCLARWKIYIWKLGTT